MSRKALCKKLESTNIQCFLASFLEATPGFGPGIRVLQTRALPLGYVAIKDTYGAGNGAQTRDLRLGKAALYQLSYSRKHFSMIAKK